MQSKSLWRLLPTLGLLLTLGLWAPGVAHVAAQSTPSTDEPYISEVAPAADAAHPAWVELTVGRVALTTPPATNRIFLPLVQNSNGQVAVSSVQSAAAPSAGTALGNWRISDEDGNNYVIPTTLPDLPKGTRIVILFDGQGPATDDLDFGDGSVRLHTPAGLSDIFEKAGDQVALYDDANQIKDFVAWGQAAGEDQNAAVAAGIWTPDSFIDYDPGFGAGVASSPAKPGESIGIWQASLALSIRSLQETSEGLRNWVSYSAHDSSQGALNPPPAPLHTTVDDGAVLDSDNLGLAWSGIPGADHYEFALATTPDFTNILTKTEAPEPGWRPTTKLADGDYYWHVRGVDSQGNVGNYLGPLKFSLIDLNKFVSLGTIKQLLKTDEYKIQHKDSPLLDIGGGPNNIVGANNAGDRRFPKSKNWDAEHVDANNVPSFGWNGIDNWYCVRASTSMLNDYYGGHLSQDRISYYMFEEWPASGVSLRGVPEHDLGFGSGIGGYGSQEQVLGWALGTSITAVNYCPSVPADPTYSCPNPNGAPMTFNEVKSLIDSGKPFMSINLNNAHARVVDGYWEITPQSRWVHLIDPVPADTGACPTCTNAQWIAYTSFANTHERALYAAGPVNARSDETSINTDSDGDGISDFDEINRFHTNPHNKDTDGDWVNDKEDMAEYIFNSSNEGTYVYTPGMTPKTSDYDGDGLRKELDWDNDNDGVPDGCEDINVDGTYQPAAGETSNFNANSKQICQPHFSIVKPVTGQATNAGDPTNPDKVLIRLSVALPSALPNKPAFKASQFSATIGGLNAAVISGAQVGQEFWLLVQAPGQADSKFYDLTVNFSGAATGHQDATKTEPNAIYYIPRPRMDTVVVVDTSGSMNDLNKLGSAKNAARLYIDQWSTDDRIGLVTFADTGNLAKALTPVQASGQALTDTKNLLNGLTANGQTAMGAGLKLGQDQLTAQGDASHDQSLMLLTDGQENVAPYWADATVSGVIVPSKTVINTIGFGPYTSTWFGLLQQIAGATGGAFGAVDDPGAVNAASAANANAVSSFPSTSENRLADVYKYAAERLLGEQRLYEATGVVSREAKTATHRFFVDNVPSLVLSANVAVPSQAALDVYDPYNNKIDPTAVGVEYRHDQTHEQYRIATPKPGLWHVDIRWLVNPLGAVGGTEYIFFAAADSPLTMNFVVGDVQKGPVVAGGTLDFAPLAVWLADSGPVHAASVTVDVQNPNGQAGTPITLLDDGAHGDGEANDGIYGGVIMPKLGGTYLLKAKATGNDNKGEAFERHAQDTLTYCSNATGAAAPICR